MSNLDQFFDQSNNITLALTREDIIKQIKSAPILMKYLNSTDAFAEYQYKGRVDKKHSLSQLLNNITNDNTSYSFIEIRGNGSCLYNTVLTSLMIQNKGTSVRHLLNDLQPHEEIALTNPYNQQIINFMETNYWQVDAALEPFGKKYLSEQFAIPPNELEDIALYGFTKALCEPIQNFQQLGNLLANLFNVVIVLFEGQINGETTDNLECICIAPEQIVDKNTIKHRISTNMWRVVYVINTSTHYNLAIPHISDSNLLINEFNLFFNKIIDKVRFA